MNSKVEKTHFSLFKVKVKFGDLENGTKKSAMLKHLKKVMKLKKLKKRVFTLFKVKVKFDDLENVTKKSTILKCSKKVFEAFL